MGKKINLVIDHIKVAVDEGATILDAARLINVKIPTLCNHPDLNVAGNCRVCMVEQVGARTLVPACAMPVSEGMEILTNSHTVRTARKHIIELLLSEHNAACTKCYKNGKCELQSLAAEYKISNDFFIDLADHVDYQVDYYSTSIVKDDSKCIRCQRCVRTCEEMQSVSALSCLYKGEKMRVGTFREYPLYEVICTNCGQCINRCPTGAIVERNYIEEVWSVLSDPTKHVVVQTAPSVRIALGEELGYDVGERVTGKLVSALRRLGFSAVLDTDFTADLTIMEEAYELLGRLQSVIKDNDHSVILPMTTSCSPGWVKFIEHVYPEMLGHVSSCKSPQQMFGALVKTYYSDKKGINPEDIVSVSVMPCTAKKFEADRPEMRSSGFKDVDYVLTTRELAIMIKQAGIDFLALKDEEYDNMMGASTGAGVIFGATGGVMEAALRTAWEVITGKEIPFPNLKITPVRGMQGVKEATVHIKGTLPEWDFLENVDLKVAIAHGLVNAKKLMDRVKYGKTQYHFIEIMACPGGCLGGGGQPYPTSEIIRKHRMEAIYTEDESMPIRKSHENPEVIHLYEEFLKEPCGHKSHELLHTHYRARHKI